MCLQMAPVHAVNSGIGGTALAVGGVFLTGVGAFIYRMRSRIKHVFGMK